MNERSNEGGSLTPRTRDMRGQEMILVIGARGNVASDWNFSDSRNGKVKGRVEGTREVRGCENITSVDGSKNITTIDRSKRIIAFDHYEIIGIVRCQGGHAVKGHHFADSQ
jgi:hypothetical protein